jgi:uncharacterized RDD family membrane protein YckC
MEQPYHMEENTLVNEQSHLADELSSYIQYEKATMGQRFLNFLIDNLLMRFGLSYLTGTIVGYLLAIFFPEYMSRILYNRTSFDFLLIVYTVAIFNYLIYYTFCEKVFRGYTLGKLVTGTRAICEDGTDLTFKDAFLRSLSRLVPFEALSALGYSPWHDRWTKTMVIKAR